MKADSQVNRPASETVLPEGWRRVPLSSVAEVRFSNVDKKTNLGELPVRLCNYMDVYTNDYIVRGMPFLHASATRSEIARFALRQGDVIITKDSETPDDIGIPAVVDDVVANLVCGYHLALIRPNLGEVDPTFLAKQIGHHTTARFFGQRATGSTRYGLANSAVEGTPISLPSLKAQKTIALVIRCVDRVIEQTEALIAKYQRIKTGLMQDLLTRGIDEHGRLRNPTTNKFKPSPFGPIPEEWACLRSEQLCRDICVGIVIKPSQYYRESGVPTLRSANIREQGVVLDGMVFISEEANRQLAKSILREGYVVSVRTGYPGTSAVIPYELDGANCVDLVISKPGPEILPQYLALWINSPLGKDQVLRGQGGLAQQHFNVAEMRNLLVLRPEIPEQQAILNVLNAQGEVLNLESKRRTKLQKLRAGLMQDLLTGKVPVEPLLGTKTTGS